jgi:hypothetical protein
MPSKCLSTFRFHTRMASRSEPFCDAKIDAIANCHLRVLLSFRRTFSVNSDLAGTSGYALQSHNHKSEITYKGQIKQLSLPLQFDGQSQLDLCALVLGGDLRQRQRASNFEGCVTATLLFAVALLTNGFDLSHNTTHRDQGCTSHTQPHTPQRRTHFMFDEQWAVVLLCEFGDSGGVASARRPPHSVDTKHTTQHSTDK